MPNYRTIKIRPATYHALKVLAAQRGVTMLDLFDQLAKEAKINKVTDRVTPSDATGERGETDKQNTAP